MWRFYDITTPQGSLSLPSVTSVIGNFNPAKPFLERATAQSEIGTQADALICRIATAGKIPGSEWRDLPDPVKQSIRAYLRWQMTTGFKADAAHVTVYSLKHGYAGELDLIGTIKRFSTLLDLKTGSSDPELVRLQMVAYMMAYLEMHPRRTISDIRGVYLNKKTGDFKELIVTKDEVTPLFDKFLDMLNQAIPETDMQIKEVNLSQQITPYQEKKLTQYQNKTRELTLTQPEAIQILKTACPDCPEVIVKKAAVICATYGLDPLLGDLFPIPFERKDGGKDWVLVLGIKAKRKLTNRSGPYTYLDYTPRMISETEGQKIYGKRWQAFSTGKIIAITILKDLKTGKIAQGIGWWPEGVNAKGSEKGNTPENMAMIRSESQAMERLRGAAIPAGLEVYDESFFDVPGGDFPEASPEMIASEDIPALAGAASETNGEPATAGDSPAAEPDNKCPLHPGFKFAWQSGKYGSFEGHKKTDGKWCYKKNIAGVPKKQPETAPEGASDTETPSGAILAPPYIKDAEFMAEILAQIKRLGWVKDANKKYPDLLAFAKKNFNVKTAADLPVDKRADFIMLLREEQ